MRILATRVRQDYAPGTTGAQLHARGVEALRDALVEREAAPRYIYDGLLSREQAARGAVIGQYVRIAQSETDDFEASTYEGRVADFHGVRRDLMQSLLLQMMGAGAEPVLGAHVTQVI